MTSLQSSKRKLLLAIFAVGCKQKNEDDFGKDRSDGSVSCIILVASTIGFFFPFLEIFEKPSFFLLQFSLGCLCLISTAAWLYLFYCSTKRPEIYLDHLTCVADPAAQIIYNLLIIFTLVIIVFQGLNVIVDMTCYITFLDYHYLFASISRTFEIFFCPIQTVVLIFLTRGRLQHKLKVNYVLAISFLTNGILWIFTSLKFVKHSQDNVRENVNSSVITCFYESKIYENIISPLKRVSLQIHLQYFIICVGLSASILQTHIQSPEINQDKRIKNPPSGRNQQIKNRYPSIIVTFGSLFSFIPNLVVLLLIYWKHPSDIVDSEYLRGWRLLSALIPTVLLIISVYCGLHRIKKDISSRNCYASNAWIFHNDAIFIICLVGDTSWCILHLFLDLSKSFAFLLTLLCISYLFQVFLQAVFLLILERIDTASCRKLQHIALFLCMGNLILWWYPEYVLASGGALEIPREAEHVILSLMSMNRFLSFLRFYRIYSIPDY